MRGVNHIVETLSTKNLQNLQDNKIQALILSLQSLIPTGTSEINPAPQRKPEQQEPIIKYEEEHPTPTNRRRHQRVTPTIRRGRVKTPNTPSPNCCHPSVEACISTATSQTRIPVNTIIGVCCTAREPSPHSIPEDIWSAQDIHNPRGKGLH